MATVLVVAGCASVAPPSLYFPTYGPMNGLPTAELAGTLIEENGCLWVESDGSRWLVLWPGSARAVEADIGVVVREGTNEAVVGEPVRMGGGEYSDEHYEFVVDLIGEEIPPACRTSGLYWLGHEARAVGVP